MKGNKPKKSSKPRPSAAKSTSIPTAKAKAKLSDKNKANGQTEKVKGKAKADPAKGKGKGKTGAEGKEKDKKPRPKPEKKPEVPVDPPRFEKIDTRLGREEVEHRIMVSSLTLQTRDHGLMSCSCGNTLSAFGLSCLYPIGRYRLLTILTDLCRRRACGVSQAPCST